MKNKGTAMGNPRTTCFDIEPAERDKEKRRQIRQAIINSQKRYAGMVRHTFAIVSTASAAAATPTETENGFVMSPDSSTADYYLSVIFGREQVNKTRDFLHQLYPHWDPDLYDRIWRRVDSAFRAKDPELRANRGFLTLQGARKLGWFDNEPIPFRKDRDTQCKYLERGVVLHWDRALGPIEFRLKDVNRLDAGRWQVWRNVVSGKWPRGEGFLHCRDGRLYFRVTYERPTEEKKALNPEREMEVAFSEDVDKYVVCKLRKGHAPAAAGGPSLDVLKSVHFSAEEVVTWLNHQKIADEKYARRQAACGKHGECRRGEGFGKQRAYVTEKRKKHTDVRTNFCKTWNHVWTTRIARFAEAELCANLSLYLPQPASHLNDKGELVEEPTAKMFGHPWPFAQFAGMLKYKAAERGIKLTVYNEPPAEVPAEVPAVAPILLTAESFAAK